MSPSALGTSHRAGIGDNLGRRWGAYPLLQAEMSLAEGGGDRQGWNLQLFWVFWTKPRTDTILHQKTADFGPNKGSPASIAIEALGWQIPVCIVNHQDKHTKFRSQGDRYCQGTTCKGRKQPVFPKNAAAETVPVHKLLYKRNRQFGAGRRYFWVPLPVGLHILGGAPR